MNKEDIIKELKSVRERIDVILNELNQEETKTKVTEFDINKEISLTQEDFMKTYGLTNENRLADDAILAIINSINGHIFELSKKITCFYKHDRIRISDIYMYKNGYIIEYEKANHFYKTEKYYYYSYITSRSGADFHE